MLPPIRASMGGRVCGAIIREGQGVHNDQLICIDHAGSVEMMSLMMLLLLPDTREIYICY